MIKKFVSIIIAILRYYYNLNIVDIHCVSEKNVTLFIFAVT